MTAAAIELHINTAVQLVIVSLESKTPVDLMPTKPKTLKTASGLTVVLNRPLSNLPL